MSREIVKGKKKLGGPRRQPERSSERVMLRLTPQEHAEVQKLAATQGLSVGQLIRLTALAALGTARAVEAGETTIGEQAASLAAIKSALSDLKKAARRQTAS